MNNNNLNIERGTVMSTISSVRSVSANADVAEIFEILTADGAVIIEDLLSEDQVKRLNSDIDQRMGEVSLGGQVAHTDGHFKDFFGNKTKRMTNLVTHSKVFRDEILQNEVVLGCLDKIFSPISDTYLLGTAQVIDIHPGQKAQPLHRDSDTYGFFRKFGPNCPEVITNFIIALCDYDEEIGATRVIPKSHLWNDFNEPVVDAPTIAAVMKPGSALWISGKVVHGGGANLSTDRVRRGVAFAFNANWLLPEEASPLLIPLEIARSLPPRIQQILGFRSQHNVATNSGTLWTSDYRELADYFKLD